MTSAGIVGDAFASELEKIAKKKKRSLHDRALWFVHNTVAHPFMAVAPGKLSNRFHDATVPKGEKG